MPGGAESELKFVFSPNELPSVEAALSRQGQGLTEGRRLVSHYFDTEDDYLWRHGATLRLRDDGKNRIQTIKREQASALTRDEYEAQTRDETPDLAAFERTPLARLLKKQRLQDRLRANIDVDITREVSNIEIAGSEIEVALDKGEIRSNGAALWIGELELELKAGKTSGLFELARKLSLEAPILLSFISKAERGHMLGGGAWGRAFKGRPSKITRRMTCAEAFRLLCHTCLHDFSINIQALHGDDRVEAVHQGRIALRRLRAALRLFKAVVEDDAYQRLDEGLKWISHIFGGARDLDVFQEESFQPRARDGAIPGARALANLTNGERQRAHEQINAALSSSRLRLLLVDLMNWIEDGDWLRGDRKKVEEPIGRFARRALKKRLRKFTRRARDLAELDPAGQHKVRIRAKKLRYMAGFFKPAARLVAKPKALRNLLAELEQMQNCLGKLHDEKAKADFLIDQVKRLPADADPMVAYAAGSLAHPAENSGQKLSKAVAAYREVAEHAPF